MDNAMGQGDRGDQAKTLVPERHITSWHSLSLGGSPPLVFGHFFLQKRETLSSFTLISTKHMI